jgi:leader peptidase (prepilin peptidase)/N-methyltransferase
LVDAERYRAAMVHIWLPTVGSLAGVVGGLATPWLGRRLAGLDPPPSRWLWAGTGLGAGAVVGWRLAGATPPTVLTWLVLVGVGVPLAAIDLRCLRLPDALVLPALVTIAALAAAVGEVRALAAAAVLVATLTVVALLPRSQLGFGDIKISGVLGIGLGLLGWRTLVVGMMAAFALGGIAALALLATGRATRTTPLPFGPWLLLGAALAVVVA